MVQWQNVPSKKEEGHKLNISGIAFYSVASFYFLKKKPLLLKLLHRSNFCNFFPTIERPCRLQILNDNLICNEISRLDLQKCLTFISFNE